MVADKPIQDSVGVLFVCLGNICRSPTAEGVMRHRLASSGIQIRVQADSAGTGDYHIGRPPDQRAILSAANRGVRIDNLRARQVNVRDFAEFDYIIAMDQCNYRDLLSMASSRQVNRVRLMMDFAPHWSEREVPDPYYGDGDGFEHVLDMIEDAVEGLLKEIQQRYAKAS